MEDRGFTFGVYSDSGLYTCSQGGRPYKIPGSWGYYEQDAATFASWGVKYLKVPNLGSIHFDTLRSRPRVLRLESARASLSFCGRRLRCRRSCLLQLDFCNTVVNGSQLDPRYTYPNMSIALNKTGAPIVFESCEWGDENPWEWAGQWMNHWRITGDHQDNWASTASVIEGAVNKSMVC